MRVLVVEDDPVPRTEWKMAVILSVEGTSATVRNHHGNKLQKPVNKLIPLEISAVEELDDDEDLSPFTQNGRETHSMITRAKARGALGNC